MNSAAFKIMILTVLLVGSTGVFAQQISALKFQQDSDYKFDEDVLWANVQSHVGTVYSERSVNEDIKRLHAMGVFQDVVAETKHLGDGSVAVTFRIKPQPLVSEVKIVGAKKYKEKKLLEEVRVVRNTPLNNAALRASADALRRFYVDKGHNDALIEPKVIKKDDFHVSVIFNIKENLRLRVGKVEFIGPKEFKVYKQNELRERIATRYSILSHPWLSWAFSYGTLDRDELGKDRVRLRDAYWEKGYLDFRVKKVSLQEEPDNPEIVNVIFEIEEGLPYKVGKVTFPGAKRFKAAELGKLSLLKTGQIYSSLNEKADVDQFDQKYSRLGYADFSIRPRLSPDYQTHTVDVDYVLQEGQIYKINNVFISGNRWTKDHVIRRELPIAPGDPVDKNLLKVSKNRLMGMGYFKTVEAVSIRSEKGGPDTKDIDIKVEEKRFIDARIGGSWTDSDSLSGSLELSHNNFDILDPMNYFTGGGQRLRLLGVIGLERYNFEVDFTEPWLFGIPLRWDVSGYYRNVYYEDWEESRLGFTTSLTKRVFDDFTSISGGYTFEQVNVHDMSRGMSHYFTDEQGRSFVGRIHLALDRDTRDSATDPRRGYNVNAMGAVSSRLLGGSYDYLRMELRGMYYYTFFNNWLTLSVGGKVGALTPMGSGQDMVPLYERYFLGGGDSVRGFSYRSIGPTDNDNNNYGGQTMYIITAELSHPIYSIVRGALFVDLGDASANTFQFRTVNMGIGYGLRIKLPSLNVPLRLDFAFPIVNNQDGAKNSLAFHFNLGASLGPK